MIRTAKRDDLQAFLAKHDIFAALHYPVPLHLQKAYAGHGFNEGDFPVTEKVAKEILSLPMFPGLTEEQQIRVAEKIKEFQGKKV